MREVRNYVDALDHGISRMRDGFPLSLRLLSETHEQLLSGVHGVLPQPLLYVSGYFEEHRSRYYELLMHTSRTGDFAPWIKNFLRAVATQATEAEDRTVRLVELQAMMRKTTF